MSIVETEVHDLRNKLAKQLVADPASQETIQDLIAALGKVPMKLDLLRTSKVGVTVQEVKKLYAGEKLGSEAKQLLNKWRKEVSGGEDSDKKGKDTSSQKGHTNSSDVGQDSAAATPSVDEEDDSMYKDLTDTRLMVLNMFQKQFEPHCEAAVAKFLAFRVENALNSQHNSLTDSKTYMTKTKSLVFNLKKNEALRKRIVDGELPPDHLPHLTANELATADVRDNREETAKSTTMARRSDLYEITRNEMLQSIGIDPNKGGEFRCRKCKGTKTSHYSLQTRSSDEPMTVFVCCLTCGFRWRTQ